MALGTTAAILLGLGAAGAGVGISKVMSAGANKAIAAPTPLPQPPAPEEAAAQGADAARKKRASMSNETVYTSPLGIAGQADITRKVLLGQ